MKFMKTVSARLVVFALASSLVAGQSIFALTAGRAAAGEIIVTGKAVSGEKPFVLINGEQAFTGRTFFSSDTITTTETSSASVNFGKAGRIELGPNSILNLGYAEGNISGALSAGSIRVSNGEGVSVKIVTPDDTVTNESTGASIFSVTAGPEALSVSVEQGAVRYNNGNSVLTGQDDDDDDDQDGNIWVPIAVIGGAIATVILFTVFEDDDDVVSPVR